MCTEQKELVRTTVQQIDYDPPAYVFLVTNLTDSPIYSFMVGSWIKKDLLSAPWNNPQKMDSPNGWETFAGPGYESPYLRYMWTSKNKENDIKPDKSESGFRIYLPKTPQFKQKLYNSINGKEAKQTEIKDLEFRVFVRDGSKCYSGTIDIVDYMTKEEK